MTKITLTHYLKVIVTVVLAILANWFLIPFILYIEQNPNQYFFKTIYEFFYYYEFYYIEYLTKYSLIAILLLVLIDLFLVIRMIFLFVGYFKTKKGYE